MEGEGDGEAGGKPRKGEKRFLKVKLLEWQQEEDINFFSLIINIRFVG